jgi:septum formation protein
VPSSVDEAALAARNGTCTVAELSLLLARAKAEDVAARPGLPVGAVVLGCDSLLEVDGEAHGRPADAEHARQSWHRMRGRWGVLHTGHWVVEPGGPGRPSAGAVGSATVHFADLDDAEIDAYVATGEPLRVAGAFTLDGLGGPFVTRIEGDHHTVVGVSLPLLRTLLAGLGVPWPRLWADPT